MNIKFQSRLNLLPSRLEELGMCIPTTRIELSGVPLRGVYLFVENGNPIYIGRTNRMRKRLLEHGRASSGHNDASFAFKLAKAEVVKLKLDIKGKRKELEQHPDFRKLFVETKKRVSQMAIKYVEIADSVDQCLFEVYASEVLNTPYNDFENH